MSGQQSAGFDLVMEFSETPLQDLLGVAFDTSDFLCGLIDLLNIPCQGFNVSVSLDRPTDVVLSASQTDAVDIQISGALGVSWRIRLIVGVDVDRSRPGLNVARLNLHDRLYHLSATIGAVPANTTALGNRLRDTVRAIPLVPMVVSSDPNAPTVTPIRLDVRVIDATVGENAFAVCLTFGGGSPGDLANLTTSAIPAGSTATLMMGFGWLLRLMEPGIEAGIGLAPGDFVDGHLTHSVEIDSEHDVNLTRLDFTLEDGFVQVRSRVEKNGFCYTASADFGGDFRLEVRNSRLLVDADISDPDFDIDVPWYCWIGAGFLGALLGGLVGAILVPLLLYLVTSTVENVVNTVADTIIAAINAATPSVDVPAIGFNLIFQNAFIDDIGIGCRFVVRDTAPVRGRGTVRLRPGQEFDLDDGTVGATIDGADLRWTGQGTAAKLEALCVSRIAATPWVQFDEVPRYRLYGLDYSRRVVPISELGFLQVIDLPFVDDIEMFLPSLAVYAVRTNERRLALVQVIALEDDTVTLRYKTFGFADPVVKILGAFACPPRTRPSRARRKRKGGQCRDASAHSAEDRVAGETCSSACCFAYQAARGGPEAASRGRTLAGDGVAGRRAGVESGAAAFRRCASLVAGERVAGTGRSPSGRDVRCHHTQVGDHRCAAAAHRGVHRNRRPDQRRSVGDVVDQPGVARSFPRRRADRRGGLQIQPEWAPADADDGLEVGLRIRAAGGGGKSERRPVRDSHLCAFRPCVQADVPRGGALAGADRSGERRADRGRSIADLHPISTPSPSSKAAGQTAFAATADR